MPFTWQDIQKNLLSDQSIDYAPDEVVEAINQVETALGSDWLTSALGSSRGAIFIIPIIELGKIIKIIKDVPNGSSLIKKIKKNPPTAPQRQLGGKASPSLYSKTDSAAEYSHAIQVGQLAAHYRKHNLEVEIEPELDVNGRLRTPDLRVKYCSVWVYIEVVCPIFSKAMSEAICAMGNIADRL